MIQVKRVYEPAVASDGQRLLVERLWPRGIRKESLQIDAGRKMWRPARSCGSGSGTTRQSGRNFAVAISASWMHIRRRGNSSWRWQLRAIR